MSWVGAEGFDAVFALRPELHRAWRDFHALFWKRRLVPPVILELCRLRVAAQLGCRTELAVRTPAAVETGLDERKVDALADHETSPLFDGAERACLRFADRFVSDVHGIRDEDAAAVVAALGDAGTVALAEALALFDGFCRFRLLLGIEPEGG